MSPQVMHGPFAVACENDLAGVLDCAANTDRSFCRSALLHAGQAGVSLARVRCSKWFPQPRHSYSKRGMDIF